MQCAYYQKKKRIAFDVRINRAQKLTTIGHLSNSVEEDFFVLKTSKSKSKIYAVLYINFVLLSLSSVFANIAGQHDFLTLVAITLYVLSFLLLILYAIVWQQVLKRIPLTIAFANRPVTILLGIIWGILLFSEEISIRNIIGIIIAFTGVVIVVKNSE